jgi:hypothetical protein
MVNAALKKYYINKKRLENKICSKKSIKIPNIMGKNVF